MKATKMLGLLLAASLVFTGCSANNISDTSKPDEQQVSDDQPVDPFRLPEPVEVKVIKSVLPDLNMEAGETIEDNAYTKYVFERTNIKTKVMWYASSTDYDQKMQLAIASNDIPDMMVVDEKTFRAMAASNQLEDLTKVYEKYVTPEIKKFYQATDNKVIDSATYGGKLLAIPSVGIQADAPSMLWVRQDWLDKLGLQPPKNIGELRGMLKAFVEQDPDGNGSADTIGLTGNNVNLSAQGGGLHDFKGIFIAFKSYPLTWVKDEAGNTVYGSTMPETKEALAVIRDMYKEGLIDKEFALRKSPEELVASGKAGAFFGPWWTPWALTGSVKNDPKADWKAYMVADKQGEYNIALLPAAQSYLVVKKGFKHPEAAIVYANMYDQVSHTPNEKEKELIVGHSLWPLTIITDYPNAATIKHELLVDALAGKVDPDTLDGEMQLVYKQALKDKENPRANADDWAAPHAYLEGAGVLKLEMNATDPVFNTSTKTMERRWANLQKLENETFYKIVLGSLELNAFDKFVEDWKAEGGTTIIKEIDEEILK
ncbi:extracellular solute-binding protein [Paenibacillus sp. LHD-38]|uniref:extracellular solute-binding protein n=1 Tax=Paenibacillus sp. LHD-38 TaxID=3072143 RepID=UPI00280F4B17|nr:extracellular solute-binding protein [Paenibacillus sp. LHD-38]MDQ8736784.1 extracellular solute-binding protein [Paenibacillus sp. LHD-38]